MYIKHVPLRDLGTVAVLHGGPGGVLASFEPSDVAELATVGPSLSLSEPILNGKAPNVSLISWVRS